MWFVCWKKYGCRHHTPTTSRHFLVRNNKNWLQLKVPNLITVVNAACWKPDFITGAPTHQPIFLTLVIYLSAGFPAASKELAGIFRSAKWQFANRFSVKCVTDLLRNRTISEKNKNYLSAYQRNSKWNEHTWTRQTSFCAAVIVAVVCGVHSSTIETR